MYFSLKTKGMWSAELNNKCKLIFQSMPLVFSKKKLPSLTCPVCPLQWQCVTEVLPLSWYEETVNNIRGWETVKVVGKAYLKQWTYQAQVHQSSWAEQIRTDEVYQDHGHSRQYYSRQEQQRRNPRTWDADPLWWQTRGFRRPAAGCRSSAPSRRPTRSHV